MLTRMRRAWDAFTGRERPRLILQYEGRLSEHQTERLRQQFKHGLASGKALVLEDGFTVSQLIDGRWLPVPLPAIPPPATDPAPDPTTPPPAQGVGEGK